MKRVILILIFLVSWIWPGFAQNSSHFVTVKGTSFQLDGHRYCFLGTNFWYGVNLGALAEGGNRARLIRELDALQKSGISNLRIMGASEGLARQFRVWPTIQPEAAQYDERLLKGMDFLLAEMAKRNLKAVIYLNNFWEWSGGMAQYVSWATKEPYPDAHLPQFTWTQFMNFSAKLYTNAQAEKWFENYVQTIIERKNTINGVEYKNDPTIMAWELANEPRAGTGEFGKNNVKNFLKWIHHASEFIRSLDGNHLITTGSEGTIGCLGDADLFEKVHSDPNIDYATFHLWAFNWGWFKPQKAAVMFDSTLKKAHHYIRQHIRLAKQINKPIVLEEFGLPRDGHSFSPKATTFYRDRYYQKLYEWVFQNVQNDGPLAGSNFWGWAGEGRARDPRHPQWKRGDDFTADPPQEPQGLNSVFDSDSSTIKILKLFAKKMNAIK